jgi:hypothetical protein
MTSFMLSLGCSLLALNTSKTPRKQLEILARKQGFTAPAQAGRLNGMQRALAQQWGLAHPQRQMLQRVLQRVSLQRVSLQRV